MGLIVEEDPLSRVLFGLSKERNLTGFHLLGVLDAAIPPVVTGKNGGGELLGKHAQEFCSRSRYLIDIQLQPAESPSWRVLNTLVRGLLRLW
ncbi:MAG: hypothetical protein QGD91_12220 [Actinomycetota bacterium]|nr:hypothetical protein [Actinomycetota bacterium]